MNVTYIKTESGDELAVLPRAELEALRQAVSHAEAIAEYRAGRLPGLSVDETRQLMAALSPLSFWRKYRGKTQAALATEIGVAQNYLSEIENGKRVGGVGLWVKIAAALNLPLEMVIDDSE